MTLNLALSCLHPMDDWEATIGAPDCVVIPRSIGRTALDSRNSSLGFMSAQRRASAHFPGNSLGHGLITNG